LCLNRSTSVWTSWWICERYYLSTEVWFINHSFVVQICPASRDDHLFINPPDGDHRSIDRTFSSKTSAFSRSLWYQSITCLSGR
jgi:hypothetical protein